LATPKPRRSRATTEREAALIPPPPTERELAKDRELAAAIAGLAAQLKELKQHDLDTAVLLAQQAARGRGPLVDHFAELGRRFRPSLRGNEKPTLRVTEGGQT
jgi:hypothetical protein